VSNPEIAGGASSQDEKGIAMNLTTVKIDKPEGVNFIPGQTHFNWIQALSPGRPERHHGFRMAVFAWQAARRS
jgi:hypothetical protein